MEQADIDCVIIGAGVVGLACARALAQQGRDVLVLESEEAIGTGISSRNSEVIHAGIYYPAGSLKARLCVAGKQALYEFCESHNVTHKRCGKLIVATDETQVSGLAAIETKAIANEVTDLTFLSRHQVVELEPHLNCSAALLSPSTGVVDSHGLMLALQGDAEDCGTMIAFNAPVEKGELLSDGRVRLHVGGEMPMSLNCILVVNSAGLSAPKLARQIEGFDAKHVPQDYLCKGSYFTLEGRAPFSHLIYPMPNEAGLGVHLTLDLGGQAKFGPDTEWMDELDYPVDPTRAASFYEAIRSYWPDLADGSLQPGYSGFRPKIAAPGEPAADFLIQGQGTHGAEGVINLFGIESPGLTSSLAIAEEVGRLAKN